MTNRAKIFTSLGAGAMAGAVAKSVIAPLDRTKIYFQTNPNKNYRFKGAVKFLRKTYTENGVLALWRGNSATMARIIPYAAVQFMAHEQYKTLLGINQLKPKRYLKTRIYFKVIVNFWNKAHISFHFFQRANMEKLHCRFSSRSHRPIPHLSPRQSESRPRHHKARRLLQP